VREQCAESLLVAGGGAVLSMLVMQVLIRALDVEVPMAASWMVSVQPQVNAPALATASVALLLSLVVFGLEPALQLTRRKGVREDLDAGAGSPSVPRARRQRTLLRWQAAISAGLFIIATLCIRQVVVEAGHDSGVDVDHLSLATINFHVQGWDEGRARRGLQRVLEQARREPGVEAVAVSTGLPFGTTMTPLAELSTTDKPLTTRDFVQHETAILISASPDFFRASGISILRGRGFDDRDDAATLPLIVVSESTARAMFGTADAVGRDLLLRIDFLGAKPEQMVRTARVIGVAEDTDTTHFLSREGNTVYTPFAQEYSPYVTLVARAPDPATALGALRAAVRKADPDLAIAQAATGRAMLTGMYLFLRGLGIAALSLGAITLLLAMVGLYGVQSHILAYRTREIGVRMSLGATARQIERMALNDGYRPVLEGLGIGLFIGLAGRIIIRSVVVAPIAIVDPWMLAIAPIALIAAAFWACYLPARRASRVDPNVALRHL
jgi:predicted permease